MLLTILGIYYNSSNHFYGIMNIFEALATGYFIFTDITKQVGIGHNTCIYTD